MRELANYQDVLKVIAIIAMIIDHLGLYFFPEYIIFRLIGRTAMPFFCFFAGYNFKGTVNFKLLLIGIILIIINYIIFRDILSTANILISIFLGQAYLYFANNYIKDFYSAYFQVILLSLLWPFTWNYFDYGTVAIAIMVLGFAAKKDPSNLKLCTGIALVISVFHTIAVFGFYYSTLVITVAQYILFNIWGYRSPVNNIWIRWLSRNSAYIYSIHLALIQFVWAIWYSINHIN